MAALTLGQLLISTNDEEEGSAQLEKAIRFCEGKRNYRAALIRARQLLMSVFPSNGDDALYTEQLMEVGRLSEGSMDPVEYLPIVKYAPLSG